MIRAATFLLAATLAAILVAPENAPAQAADVGAPYSQGPGGFYRKDDRSGPYAVGSDGVPRLLGSQSQGASNVFTTQVSVSATSTQIVPVRAGRGAVTVLNLGTTAVYLGPSGTTTSTGFLLPGVVGASVTVPTTAAIFGITASGTQSVAVLETY